MLLDMAVRREDERLRGLAVGEVVDVLGDDRMQPGQPVGAADRQDISIGPLNDAGGTSERPLLAERIAVVPRQTGIDAIWDTDNSIDP